MIARRRFTPGLRAFRAVAGLAAVSLALAPAASAAGGWGRPFRIASPVGLGLTSPQVGYASSGAALIGYTLTDPSTGVSSAWTVVRSPGGGLGSGHQVAGAVQALAAGAGAGGLELLAGASDSAGSCCDRVLAVGPVRGTAAPATGGAVFDQLPGATEAGLVTVSGRLLAVAASGGEVWAAQSAPGAVQFGTARRLSRTGSPAQSFDAISSAPGHSLIAWAALAHPGDDGARLIYLADGSAARPPRSGRLALTLHGGHQIDELALAPGPRSPTVAWLESWYDSRGAFHSAVEVADVAKRLRPITLSEPGSSASGIAFAADSGGDQVLSWQACNAGGSCVMRAAVRRGRGAFGPLQRLGAVDPGESPAAMVTGTGTAVVAWIRGGSIVASSGRGVQLGAPVTVAGTGFGADLTLAAGPHGGGLAVWTQGTLNQSLRGAAFSHR